LISFTKNTHMSAFRKKIYITLVLSVTISMLSAQSLRTSFRTTARTIDLEELADPRVVYLFDEYQEGQVYYSGGRTSTLKLNYRLLVDDMVAIADRGDSRSLIRGAAFDSLRINDKLFIYHRTYGYLEKFSHDGNVFYIKYQSTHTMNEPIQGGYGQAPASSSTQRINLISASNLGGRGPQGGDLRLENVSGAEMEIVITRRPLIVHVLDGDFVTFITRRQVNRAFPDHRSEVRNFFRRNSISFDERDDLIKLGEFLVGLN
jgi:hypothetical protein